MKEKRITKDLMGSWGIFGNKGHQEWIVFTLFVTRKVRFSAVF